MPVQVAISMCLEKIHKIVVGSLSSQCRSANSGLKTCLITKCIQFVFAFFPCHAIVSKGRTKGKEDSIRLPDEFQGLGIIPK